MCLAPFRTSSHPSIPHASVPSAFGGRQRGLGGSGGGQGSAMPLCSYAMLICSAANIRTRTQAHPLPHWQNFAVCQLEA